MPELSYVSLDAFFAPFAAALDVRHGARDALRLFLLGFARWGPVFALTPFLGGRLVPNSIRIALTIVMGLFLLPGLSAAAPVPLDFSTVALWALVLEEVFVGFLLAFGASLVFWAAEMGGRFIDNVRGTTTANLLIPHVSTQSSLFGDFYFQLFVVLYVLAGGHLWFVAAVFRSYELVPALELGLAPAPIAESFLLATGHLFVVALQIMAPPLVVLMLLDVVLGVANRMAPQLDVFFISLSLKSALGALVVALSLYYVAGMAPRLFRDQHAMVQGVMEVMPAPAERPEAGGGDEAPPEPLGIPADEAPDAALEAPAPDGPAADDPDPDPTPGER